MTNNNTKIFGYCRVSSTDQNEDRQVEADKYTPTSNIVQLNPYEYPKDLLTIPEVEEKYGLGYSFVYKWVMLKKRLTAYDKAGIAVSEKELLEFFKNRSKKWQQPRKCGE